MTTNRRTAACLAACEGIPTEDLEGCFARMHDRLLWAKEAERVLREYEAWEGAMILDQQAWRGGMAPLPTLTYPLWDKLLELQAERNKLLHTTGAAIATVSSDGRHVSDEHAAPAVHLVDPRDGFQSVIDPEASREGSGLAPAPQEARS